jgi:hypothetical protein
MSKADATIRAEIEPCSTCRFWDREQPQYEFGFCHRWPPRSGLWITARNTGGYDRIEINMQTSSHAEWPNTAGTDGCGEHRPKAGDDRKER